MRFFFKANEMRFIYKRLFILSSLSLKLNLYRNNSELRDCPTTHYIHADWRCVCELIIGLWAFFYKQPPSTVYTLISISVVFAHCMFTEHKISDMWICG